MNRWKKFIIAGIVAAGLGVGCVWGANQTVGGPWRGLHDAENSILIGDNEAQSLLNVDLSETSLLIRKRAGTALFKSIGTSTWPVRGGYYFRDAAGVDNIIHANNKSVFKSVAGGNYSAFITTAVAGTYWDFVDSQGYLYGFDDNFDYFWRYDGTTLTWYPSAPQCTQGEALPDRLVIGPTSANPNRLNFSKRSDFTNFTVGSNDADPFTEDFALPGQKIRAFKYALGRLMVWTKDSTAFWTGDTQYDGVIQGLSSTIGTDQPSSVVEDLGVVYWQAQDKHFYTYDGNEIRKISQPIAASVDNFAGGQTRDWTQTTQEDFGAGTSAEVSTSAVLGSVVLTTWTATDTTAIDFASGTLVNVSTSVIFGEALGLLWNNTDLSNNSFESAFGTDWALGGSAARSTVVAKSGSWSVVLGSPLPGVTTKILDSANNVLATLTPTGSVTIDAWSQRTLDLSAYRGMNVKIQFLGVTDPTRTLTSALFYCSGSNMTFWLYEKSIGGDNYTNYVDLVEGGVSTIYNGSFISRTFDTALSSPAWLARYEGKPGEGALGNTLTWTMESSANGSSWDSPVSWSTETAPSARRQQYFRYLLSFATATASTGLPYVPDVTASARNSTGTFTSQVKEIGTAITSWGNFTAEDSTDGGTISYSIRTATSAAMLTSASWVSLTDNNQITASTNPYAQVKADSVITLATQTPTSESFTVNWNDGIVVHTWATVDKDHRILWSVGEGAASVSTATYIYDPRFDTWLKYSVSFDAPARVGSNIYFGGNTSGVVNKYPSGNTDSGAAMTAYWKSKDFIGEDPYAEKDYRAIGLLAGTAANSNLDVTYTINTSTAILDNFSLADSDGNAVKRINYFLPSGKFGTFINIKFGNDDGDAPFEVYAFRYDYEPREWRVLP